MSKLLEETYSAHKVDNVAGGLRVRHDLVVIHLVNPNIPQLLLQFRPRHVIVRILHEHILRCLRALVTITPVCLGCLDFDQELVKPNSQCMYLYQDRILWLDNPSYKRRVFLFGASTKRFVGAVVASRSHCRSHRCSHRSRIR